MYILYSIVLFCHLLLLQYCYSPIFNCVLSFFVHFKPKLKLIFKALVKTHCLSLLKTPVDSQYGPIILYLLYFIKCYVLKYISIYLSIPSVVAEIFNFKYFQSRWSAGWLAGWLSDYIATPWPILQAETCKNFR